jgi:hypothetical protein
MSLKHFHIIFIFFAILCDAGFFLWCRIEHEAAERMGIAHLGIFSGWVALGLVAYGLWYVLKKCKTIIIPS